MPVDPTGRDRGWSRMPDVDLAEMANQIAADLAYLGEDDGATMVAAHLRSFWTPAMRADLLRLAATAAPTLSPLVRRACRILDPTAVVAGPPVAPDP